jgi:predicted O-methyltransferase YrrM
VHFYSALPNTLELDHSLWDIPSEMPGIDQNIPGQVRLLNEICDAGFMDEFDEFQLEADSSEYSRNAAFGGPDGAMLYSVIRKYKPRRMIEIGAGASTLLSCAALKKNGKDYKFTTIDPYPAAYLSGRSDLEILPHEVETLPFSLFSELEADDILFIDSSHTVRIGGDVLFEMLDIIPRLKDGVVIHIHDIFLPNHYPREWILDRHVGWTEQYLVQAFLSFNKAFQILWGFNMMQVAQPNLLIEKFAQDVELDGASLWLRKVAST